MGLGKWLADKYLKANNLSGKVVKTVGEVAGGIVEGTGYVAADIAGAVGLDTASELVRNTTKTVGENISGAAKVVAGVNSAVGRAVVDTAGEIFNDEDLSIVAWDNEQDFDVLTEIEEIHNANKNLVHDYLKTGKKALDATGKAIGGAIRLAAEVRDNSKPPHIPANRGVVLSASGRWGIHLFIGGEHKIITVLPENCGKWKPNNDGSKSLQYLYPQKWKAGDVGWMLEEDFCSEYHFLKNGNIRLIVDGEGMKRLNNMRGKPFGDESESEKFILELCGMKQISEIEARGYRKTKVVIPSKEEIEKQRRERNRQILEKIKRELNEKKQEIEDKYSQEIERAEIELKDVSDEVLFKIVSNPMLPSYNRLAAQKILEERERNIYRD
ncbi:MAG: hypothetical protein J6C40_10950 [Lentisphaeria bacterium]|nr:hypothetical protein [Lentisphaeria bacterium]